MSAFLRAVAPCGGAILCVCGEGRVWDVLWRPAGSCIVVEGELCGLTKAQACAP